MNVTNHNFPFFGDHSTSLHLQIDQNWCYEPGKSEHYHQTIFSIQHIALALIENGPFVAQGSFGPSAYREPAFLLNETIQDKTIWGFQKGSRKESSPNIYVMVIGAKPNSENPSQGHVFYTLGQDITASSESPIRVIESSSTDQKIYVTSYETFRLHETDAFPPFEISQASQIWIESEQMKNHFKSLLLEFTPRNVFSHKERVKAIGWEIFNAYKSLPHGSTALAAQMMQEMVEEITSLQRVDRNYLGLGRSIESIWNGIGDETWMWFG